MTNTDEYALSLFAGIGATAKTLTQFFGDEVYMVEKWDVAAETLRLNFPADHVREEDVKQIDWKTWRFFNGPPKVITGGPPCQPFSQATAGSGEYDPRDCIPDFIEAVRVLQPEVFLMEEVKTLTWPKHRVYFSKVIRDLMWSGYRVDWAVLDMSKYGVPQARKRLFVVGVRIDLGRPVRWPEEVPGKVTMAEALEWGPEVADERARLAPVYGDASWVYERPSTTVVGSFRPEIQAAPGYRLSVSRQNAPGSVYITVDEAKVLQGLPRDWQVAGPEAKVRLQIGNSCPPQMTSAIIEANL